MFNIFYGIMWENMVEKDRPQMATWPMRFACLITNATDTNTEYTILIYFFSATMFAGMRLCVMWIGILLLC
jgi:hypothetical protein